MNPGVLVIAPLPAVRQMIVGSLQQAGYPAAGVMGADEARAFFANLRPDLVIVDALALGAEGCKWVAELRASMPDLLWLVLADRDAAVLPLLGGESASRLSKPFAPAELLAAVRALCNQRPLAYSKETLKIGTLLLDPVTYRVCCGETPIPLKPMEFRLLAFFMAHPERVFTRTELLDEVWGDQSFIDERAVDVQIRRLRATLAPHGHGERIETVRGAGYRFVGRMGCAGVSGSYERAFRAGLVLPQAALHSTNVPQPVAS